MSCTPASGSTFPVGTYRRSAARATDGTNTSAGSVLGDGHELRADDHRPGDADSWRRSTRPAPTVNFVPALRRRATPGRAPRAELLARCRGRGSRSGRPTVTVHRHRRWRRVGRRRRSSVVVRDTTPPVVTTPGSISSSSPTHRSRGTDPRVAQFLSGAFAADLVGVARSRVERAARSSRSATSAVTFTAVDAAGKRRRRRARRSSFSLPVAGQAPPPAAARPGPSCPSRQRRRPARPADRRGRVARVARRLRRRPATS